MTGQRGRCRVTGDGADSWLGHCLRALPPCLPEQYSVMMLPVPLGSSQLTA